MNAGGIQPGLVDSRHSPVLLVGDVAQHHGLAEAMDRIAQGSSMPREVVVLDALAGSGGLLQLVGSHAGKAAQQALPLLTQLTGEHVQNAPAHSKEKRLNGQRIVPDRLEAGEGRCKPYGSPSGRGVK